MQYLDEVSDLLIEDVENRYVQSKEAWAPLQMQVQTAHDITSDLARDLEHARKEYVRASKDYLAIAFKIEFMRRSDRLAKGL